MEDLSSYINGELSSFCGLLSTDPNYLPGGCNFNDDDDDPLGCPEITVKINDDWTTSSKEPCPVETDLENSTEDEIEVDSDNDNTMDSFFNDVKIIPRGESSSDEEEQLVPSSPTNISKSTFVEEFTLSGTDLDNDESEAYDSKDEEEDNDKYKKKGTANVPNEETAKRSDVGEETGNRSNPQPP